MAQAKRSPILGYNHNVKYRGVIFHVQTEDSGQQNPHLFTHLFHEGVIVSTRKYVYDSGSNEDAIKGLMQAQHKAVMKDLKKGTFDDKIDAYLSGTPGLEPRSGEAPGEVARPRGERATTEASPPPEEVIAAATTPQLEIVDDDLSEPIELPRKQRASSSDRTRPIELPIKQSAPDVSDMAAAVKAANEQQAPTPAPAAPESQPPPSKPRVSTAQKVSRSGAATPASGPRPGAQAARPAAPATPVRNTPPVIDITEDEIGSRLRTPRDTAVEAVEGSDGIPSRSGDSIPPATTPVRTGERPAAHNAASLPPSKAPLRPSMSPPIVTRPAADAPRKRAGDSEAVEIYQAAPPSVDPPPGERSERAGTYSVSRKSGDAPIREKTGRVAAINPASLGLNDPTSKTPAAGSVVPNRPGSRPPIASDTSSNRTAQPQNMRDAGSGQIPQNVPREPTPASAPRAATPPPPPAGRAATPVPVPARLTAPIQNRTSTPATPQSNSGVVMTRPAVIVGAPAKPAQPAQQRVRKAREDEGRGFGQGLISEKSLDEVILAYLSEDAEDK